MKKYIYSAVALLGFSSLTLTSCQNENEPDNVAGNKVLLTITANRGEAETRTTLEENGTGGLNCYWSEGDQLVVADNKGKKIGVVTLESVDDTNRSKGVFKGEVELGSDGNINLIYVGSSVNAETGVAIGATTIALDVSQQDGTIASLTEKDVLCAETNVINANGSAQADVQMNRRVAHGYFTLALPDGLSLDAGDVITITGTGSSVLKTQKELKFVNGGSIAAIADAQYKGATSITITKAEAGNSFYVTILPFNGGYALTPTFTVMKNGYKYTASLGNHTWKYGEYVRKNTNGDPVEVTEWTKELLPINLNDVSLNWGGENVAPKYVETGKGYTKIAGTYDGWVSQYYMNGSEGGWCTPYTYKSNGVINGALYSTRNAEPSLFQWGRWMGFPSNVYSILRLASNGLANNYWQEANNHYPPGDLIKTSPVQYQNTYDGNTPGGLFAQILVTSCNWGDNWDKTKSERASIVFAARSLGNNDPAGDYMKGNPFGATGTWADRSGNPCPDGWRIPTFAELMSLIPSDKTVSGNKVEVRDGYAIRWNLDKVNDIPCVVIQSIKATKDSYTGTESEFNEARAVKIGAYGTLNNLGQIGYKGSRAYVWSNELAYLDSYKGYLAKGLRIEFSNNSAKFVPCYIEIIQGAMIIPVRDNSAKAEPITPWFPLWILY